MYSIVLILVLLLFPAVAWTQTYPSCAQIPLVACVAGDTFTGDVTLEDEISLILGTDSDWSCNYDEDGDDQLLCTTNADSAIDPADPMFEILTDFDTPNGTNMAANQQIFGVAKGQQGSNVSVMSIDEDGDLAIAGTLSAPGGFYSFGADDSGIFTMLTSSADVWTWQVKNDTNDLEVISNQSANFHLEGGAGASVGLRLVDGNLIIGSVTAGVVLDGNNDGALTIKGRGDGSDEELTIDLDDTANTAVLSSTTALDKVDFAAIGIEVDQGVEITLGGQTLDHDGTDFIMNDALQVQGAPIALNLYRPSGIIGSAAGMTIELKDSVAANKIYARLLGVIESPTDGSEDGYLRFDTTLNGTTTSEAMRISSNNKVGIADSSPTEATLVVGAAGAGDIYATFATANSDTLCWDGSGASLITDCSSLASFKTDIEDLSLGLETVMQLTPRQYVEISTGQSDLGFIAEEVEAVNPILAGYKKEDLRPSMTDEELALALPLDVPAVLEGEERAEAIRAVRSDSSKEMLSNWQLSSVRYRHMVALLTKAIQEQQAQIEALQNRVTVLEGLH